MNPSQDNTFKLQKRVKLISKLLGYKSALELSGAKKLGEGAFGSVFASGSAAIKVSQTDKDKKFLEHEIKMLRGMGSSKVSPKFLGSGKGYLAIQKFDGLPLEKHLSRIKSDPVFADYIFRRTVEAIGSLHRKNIAQRDLHGGNIFVTDDYEIKIIDYGQAAKGYLPAYFETFFGNHTDPTTGALGLVSHLFTNVKSYQTYTKLLRQAVEKICKKKGADPKVVFTDYSSIDGDDEKENVYFDNLEKITSPAQGDNTDVDAFYNAVDSALRINTKNPVSTKRVRPNNPFISKSNISRTINRKPTPRSGVLKFEQGGIVPSGSRVVELHGKELIIPKNAIKKFRNPFHREIATGIVLAYGLFPMTNEGIDEAKKLINNAEYWISPSDLPNYYDGIDSDLMKGKETAGIIFIRNVMRSFYNIKSSTESETKVYNPADKFVDDGKEFADKILNDSETALEETSNKLTDVVDTFIEQTNNEYEEFKRKINRRVNHPKLYPELQHIKTRYMWGQNGLYDLEFKSDIDRAIYFAGKFDSNKKTNEDKIAVREWLFLVTGLNVRDDYDEIKKYRQEILTFILQLIKLHPQERDVIIPAVYDGYYQDPDDEEEYDEILDEMEEEIEDENPEGLDELLDFVRENSITDAEEKQTEEKIEEANEIGEDLEIDPDILSDLPPGLQESLVNIINKRKGTKLEPGEKKDRSSAITNTKIYKFLTNNLLKIQGQLDSINASIKEQNILLQTNLDLNLKTLQSVEEQDVLLETKLDAILNLYTNQTELIKKYEQDLKRQETEARLEAQKDSAFTTGFADVSGTGSGNSLLGRLVKFFGKKLALKLWKMLPRRLRAKARLLRKTIKPSKLFGRVAQKIALKKATDKASQKATQKFVAKGFEHIALPAVKSSDNIVAKGVQKSSDNLLTRALSSRVVQQTLVKKLGKEGAEKLTVKLAAKLIPGISTVYGLGEGLVRILMGDVKGGFLSFGSAIPIAGYGFAAVDILREIDIAAYTKHIEGPAMSGKLGDEQFAAFFAEALGVTENQYESGTLGAKPGMAMLHGTELIVDKKQKDQLNPMAIVGGSLLSATTNYINSMGPLAAAIAPTFKQIAAPIAEQYNIPKTFVQTKVGGTLPNLGQQIKKIKDKKKTPEEELQGIEKDLLQTQNSESFAEKLMKILDPEGRFQELLRQINQPRSTTTPDGGITGDLKGNIVNPMEEGDMQNYEPAKFGADRTGRPGGHMGRDIMGPPGMKVVAALPGTVSSIYEVADFKDGSGVSYGITVDHANGVQTKYMHITPSVKKGDSINAGQKIAVVSKEDKISSGSHLHFEILHKGVHQDPETFLKNSYKLKDISSGRVPGLSLIQPSSSAPPTLQGLGRQGAIGNKNFGATSGIGSKGYLIVPGHAAGGGAPQEKKLVKQLALNAYNNLKQKYPNSNIKFVDVDNMFEDTDAGFTQQKDWYKKMEKEGWEVLEVHMDASIESGQGTGRGVIVPVGELNSVEKHFSENFGAFPRGHRDLAAPNRGASIFELGNMSPELQKLVETGSVSKQQLDALTSPLEQSISSALGSSPFSPPSSRQRSRFESMQGSDKKEGTKYLIVNQPQQPSAPMDRNSSVQFVPLAPGRWRSKDEYSDTVRKLIMSRISQ